MARHSTVTNCKEDTTVATAAMTRETNGSASDRDTLFMLSGIALMVFGAGLILTNPVVQKYMSRMGVSALALGALPDLERYLRLRDM
jgi:hypothetical protein